MDLNLSDAMDDVFLESGFQETITYTPSGGSAASISAVVFREGEINNEPRERAMRGMSLRSHNIRILISRTNVASVTENEDTVALYARLGDAATRTMTVSGIEYVDDGAWMLILRS